MMSYRFFLSPYDMKQACKAAYDEWEYWENVDFGKRYNHNSLPGCYVGRKSEHGVCSFLRWKLKGVKKVEAEFKKRKHDSDIKVEDHMIEVKGLQTHQWNNLKRCIPPKQLEGYVSKNAIIVWTTTKGDDKDKCVVIQGWNYATDLEEKGEFIKTICDNIQIKEDDDMRSLESLIAVLSA